MRFPLWNLESVNGGDTERSLFPVAELNLAVDQISEGAGQHGPEFAEGVEAEVGLGGGIGGGGVSATSLPSRNVTLWEAVPTGWRPARMG